MACGKCNTVASPESELWQFATKHPFVTVVLGLTVLGWAGTLVGSVLAPCK